MLHFRRCWSSPPLLILPAPASAGTYDVVSCNVDRRANRGTSPGRSRRTTAPGKAPPDPRELLVSSSDGDRRKCAPSTGVSINSRRRQAHRSRSTTAPRGRSARRPGTIDQARAGSARNTAARASHDDTATSAAENGWWNGDRARRRLRRAASASSRPRPAPATRRRPPTYCATPTGTRTRHAVTYEIGEPVVSWGVQCAGPSVNSLCFTGDGTDGHAGIEPPLRRA